MIKLVLSDIDDTLIPLGSKCASKCVIESIYNLQSSGVYFAPASGRDTDGLEKLFQGHPDCYKTALVSNAKIIRHNNINIKISYLNSTELEKVYKVINKDPFSFMIVRTKEQDFLLGYDKELKVNWDKLDIKNNLRTLVKMPQTPIISATIICVKELSYLSRLLLQLNKETDQLDFLASSSHIVDICQTGWNKASGLNILLNELGITKQEVLFFGDSQNDLPLIDALPYSVAVENATDEVKKRATFTIGSCSENSVARFFTKLIEYNKHDVPVCKWDIQKT